MATKVRYRLQPLLEIKARHKKRAEIALAKALGKLEQEKKKLERLKEEKKEIQSKRKEYRGKLHQRVASGVSVVKDSHSHINYLRRLEEEEKEKEKEIEMQKEVLVMAETAVKRARRDYVDAAKELQVMEKHKELWKKKVQKELDVKIEREMDDIGNLLYQHQRGNQ
ncbi:MAG: hypothetical protein Q7S98_03515 [Deltaproteobacteria bacterium]|nr:hypothetical protein [Deltaproteobacteria bacterium]